MTDAPLLDGIIEFIDARIRKITFHGNFTISYYVIVTTRAFILFNRLHIFTVFFAVIYRIIYNITTVSYLFRLSVDDKN